MLQCACREAKALTQRVKQPHCPVPYCPVSVVVPSRPELRRDGMHGTRHTPNIKSPETFKELLTILGIINYLNRYLTKLAKLTAPLRELNKKDVFFRWEYRHQNRQVYQVYQVYACSAQHTSIARRKSASSPTCSCQSSYTFLLTNCDKKTIRDTTRPALTNEL